MGAADDSRPALPVRTSRYHRTGRHSSPHQLSLPPEAPALVIAVPGAATADSDAVAEAVAVSAESSCPGVDVRIGYLRGNTSLLRDVLDGLAPVAEPMPSAVVVPLLANPHPGIDSGLAAIVAGTRARVLTGGHLGPHPMLAETVHIRLAEAGLARSARAGRLSIVSEADGFIVGAVGGQEGMQAAGVVAVLLASRLALPVSQACLSDPVSVKEGAERLRAAQVSRIALAPCVIGPELEDGALAAVAEAIGAARAPTLGGHPTIGRLVAMRYGAALADPTLAGLPG